MNFFSKAATCSLCLASLLGFGSAYAGVEFKGYQTHSHITANVDPEVLYNIEKIEENGKTVGLRMILSNVREELESLKGSTDFRTDEVQFRKASAQNGSRVVYDFYFSDEAVKAGVDFFDYRNKAPSQINVDYWLKSQKADAKSEAANAGAKIVSSNATNLRKAIKSASVRGGTTSTAQAGCGKPLSVKSDPFTFWKIYHEAYDYRAFFKLMPADSNYAYPLAERKPGEKLGDRAKEVAHYRLAHKLYKDAKYALTLRTMDFFEKQYPKSELLSELRFLKASTLVQLSRLLRTQRYSDQALELYRSILLESPDSEKGKASLAYLVQENMHRDTPVMALEYALMGTQQESSLPAEQSKTDLNPSVYRLATAEALMAIGEYDRAERSYQALIDWNNKLSPEAAFRIGEVYASRNYWERAVIAYEKAIQNYPKQAEGFAPVWFNLAEAYFRLEKYDHAERVYREFDKRFGSSKAAWAAGLRIAELEQIKLKAPNPAKHEEISKLYEKVVNTHPYSPGAMLAELRLALCLNDLKSIGLKHESREFFLNMFAARDMKSFESELVDPLQTEAWFDYAEAKFSVGSGAYRKALSRAERYQGILSKVTFGAELSKVYAAASIGLTMEISKKGPSGSKELLASVEQFGKFIPKPLPLDYELAIAKAHQEGADWKSLEGKLAEIKSRMGEFSVAQKDSYYLLTALMIRAQDEAQDKMSAVLKNITDRGELADMKYDLLAEAALANKDFRTAIEYDTKLLDTDLANMLPIQKKLEVSLRRLESVARIKDAEKTHKLADQILFKFGTRTEYDRILSRVHDLRALALYDTGNFKGVVTAVDEILVNRPEHPRRSEFEFMRGKSLASLGRDSEAVETFRKLAQATASESKDEIWKKSAQAELDQIQWEGKVQNQIQDRRSSK